MALSTVVSALGNTVTVSLDVSAANAVTGVSAVNNSASTVTVTVNRPNGNVASRTLAAGATASISIPKGKQFTYADDLLADWSVSLTVG